MAHDVFISHSTKDKAISDAVCAALESARIRCWMAPRDVQPGRSFAGEINRAIQHSKVMVLIFSAHSNNSEQVLREVQLAVNSHLHIIQFRIEDVRLNDDLEYFLSTPHWLDALTQPLESHTERLATSIKALLGAEEFTKDERPPTQLPREVEKITSKSQQPSLQSRAVRQPKKRMLLPLLAVAAALSLLVAGWYFGIGLRFKKDSTSSEPRISQTETKRASPGPAVAKLTQTELYGPTLLRIGTGYKIQKGTLSAKRYGFIDKTGRVVIEPQWEEVRAFREGLAPVKRDGKIGFIDKTGRVAIEPQWEEDSGWHGFDFFFTDFNEGLARVKRDGKYGFIDKTGRVAIEPQWEEALVFVEGLAQVKRDGKYGFIDKTGRVVIEPQWTDPLFYFYEGLARVKRDGKYGFIDKTGRVVIEPQWDETGVFMEALAPVKRDGKWGFIDKTGRVIIEPQWDVLDLYRETNDSPFLSLVARQAGSEVLVVWLDYTGKKLWSTESVTPAPSESATNVASKTITATKEQPFVNSLGMKFVPVAGTQALFSVWDTRVQDYEAFVNATGRTWEKPPFSQGPTHPAVVVSWDDAKAFCQWLTEKDRTTGVLGAEQEYRLPTDAEWSVAVGLTQESGTTPREKSGKASVKNGKYTGVYPWGEHWPPPKGVGNYSADLRVDDYKETSPVGSFGANTFGLYDMGGNVTQLCEDWFDENKNKRVLRGTSWFDYTPDGMLLSSRGGSLPYYRGITDGFRVVVGSLSAR
jgi:hypothetical protein